MPRPRRRRAGALALVAVAVVQVALPLRHLAMPGDVRWTEEGYYLSWRVVLTEKAGWLQFWVTDPVADETWMVEPTLVLEDWQARQAAIRPDLALTAAHLVAEHYRAAGRGQVEVRADSWVSFNGRPRQRLLDPDVDLAAHDRGIMPFGFDADAAVLPLDPPVRRVTRWLRSRWLEVLLVTVPLLVGLGWWVVSATRDEGQPEPLAVDAAGPHFATLDELVAASDLVVAGEVVSVGEGRTITDPSDPSAGIRTRLVTIAVTEPLVGDPPEPLVLEEEAALLDGTPIVVNGVAPSKVGDEGIYFLVGGTTTDAPYHALINEQGRYLVQAGTLVPAADDCAQPRRRRTGPGRPGRGAAVSARGCALWGRPSRPIG